MYIESSVTVLIKQPGEQKIVHDERDQELEALVPRLQLILLLVKGSHPHVEIRPGHVTHHKHLLTQPRTAHLGGDNDRITQYEGTDVHYA